MKLAPVGVGRTGILEGRLRDLLTDEPLLLGGFAGSGSGTDTDIIFFFRLDDEKFFVRLLGPAALFATKRPGESGREGMLSKLSADVTLVSAGVVGRVFGVPSPSAGLGVGSGDDSFRPIASPGPSAGGLEAGLDSKSCDCVDAKAD